MDIQKIKTAVYKTTGGFNLDMGIEVLEVKDGYAKAQMKIEDRMLNPYKAIHGGVLFSMADTVGGVAALTNGYVIVTSNGTINFLRDTSNSRMITGVATVVKAGRKLSIYNIDMYDEHERYVAQATMTYFSNGMTVEEYWKV